MQYRIGDRDPVTGLYDVIHPDGSFTRNGIKVFNSAHEFGDVVLATQRSDGMMILDGAKATLTEVVTGEFGVQKFGEPPVGYLNGQVFNKEEEILLSLSVEVDMITAYRGGVFIITALFDRAGDRNIIIYPILTGTAEYEVNYTIVDDPGTVNNPDDPTTDTNEQVDGIIVNRGDNQKSIAIEVSDTLIEEIKTIGFAVRTTPRCRINNSLSLTISPRTIHYVIYTRQVIGRNSNNDYIWSPLSIALEKSVFETTQNIANYDAQWLSFTNVYQDSSHGFIYGRYFIPLGTSPQNTFGSRYNDLPGNNYYRAYPFDDTIEGFVAFREDKYV